MGYSDVEVTFDLQSNGADSCELWITDMESNNDADWIWENEFLSEGYTSSIVHGLPSEYDNIDVVGVAVYKQGKQGQCWYNHIALTGIPMTKEPTVDPTISPSDEPSEDPTATPSSEPSANPSISPSKEPSQDPTASPTENPTTMDSDESVYTEWNPENNRMYTFVTDKTCEDYGYSSIHDAATCQAAGDFWSSYTEYGFQENFNFYDHTSFSLSGRPVGCSWHDFGNVEQFYGTTANCNDWGFSGCYCECMFVSGNSL